MKKEMDKVYDPKIVEDRLYQTWLDKKYFHAVVDPDKKPYTIVIPPPNITGQLHMGHALDNAIQDILIRFKRMQGYSALWMPGCDHASISTEVKIVEKMAQEGLTKQDIGREAFLERAWLWKEEYGGTITQQLKKLGSSLDWERERFTMDKGLSDAVLEVFVKLYDKGLIYRGEKIINWCPHCQTTISDAEVNHEDKESNLWYIRYPLKDGGGFIEVATTRPETMLGDTCVAVNPKDERYTALVGKMVVLPIMNREIPIVADNYVDMAFGTGAVKITPGHDPNDFELAERHGIARINILNDDGTINENGGQFQGMKAIDARRQIVEMLEKEGLLVKTERLNHAVGVHERCGVTIEPLIKLQWFVKMEPLAKPAIEVYENKSLRFIPERFGKTYMNWLENIRDWCISRQLWWGHRIPAYYCDACGHMAVSKTAVEICPKCGKGPVRQDEDTLDTWFSSALWPFSTLGWPEKTPELEYFYPTNVLVTAYDIIFFWVVRMVFSGIEHTGQIPFQDVFIHGLIRDAEGRKFSKTLGNGVDPLEVIEQYGADALRFMLVSNTAYGNDMRFYIEKVEASRNFCNKIWNASRFVLMYMDEAVTDTELQMTAADYWITSKVNRLAQEVTQNLEKYEIGIAAQKIYDFLWDEFCDWYIEMVKPRLYQEKDPTRSAALATLKRVLIKTLKLLHPFMPFITEEIFLAFQDEEETIMLSPWPVYEKELEYKSQEKEVELIKEAVRAIRNVRQEMNVPPSKKSSVTIVAENTGLGQVFSSNSSFFAGLAGASQVIVDTRAEKEGAVVVPVSSGTIYMPLAELVDVSKEKARLEKEKEKLEKEVSRVEGKLSNQGFVAKAPPQVIQAEREKKEKYTLMLEKVNAQIRELNL